jgi:peptidoglycan/xylan/chitin deacetylase (PgdA/CDA1 family)
MMIPYWRAPYGEINDELIRYAEEIGYRQIGWTRRGGISASLDLLDWVNDPKSPLYLSGREMMEKVISLAIKPEFRGGIVLMHLGIERKGDSIQDYLPELLSRLKEKGIPVVTVRELLTEEERGSGSPPARKPRP